MKTTLTLSIVLALSACGQDVHRAAHADDPRPSYSIDPAIAPYMARYFVGAHAHGVMNSPNPDVRTIRFADDAEMAETDGIEDSTLGYCYSMTMWTYDKLGTKVEWEQKDIVIRKSTWDKFGGCVRQALISHENGHCQLNLDHVDDKNNLMYPYIVAADSDTDPKCEEFMAEEKVMFDTYKAGRAK